LSALLSLIFGTLEVAGKVFRAGGYAGDGLARLLAEYLNRTGSMIVIMTLVFLAIIVSTQFSFGTLFAAISHSVAAGARGGWGSLREWRDKRRQDKQRQEVIARQARKSAPPGNADALAGAKAADAPLPRTRNTATGAARGADDDGAP